MVCSILLAFFLNVSQGAITLEEIMSIPDSLMEERVEKLDQFVQDSTHTTQELANAHFFLAQEYQRLGFTDKALGLLSESFNLYQTLEDSAGLSRVMNASAGTYSRVQKYEQALGALKKAEKYTRELDQLKNIHATMGYVYFNLRKLDSAELYLRRSITEYREMGVVPESPMLNLSGVNVARGHYAEALRGLLDMERMGLDEFNLPTKYYILSFIAAIYHQQGKTSLSQLYQNKRKRLRQEEGLVSNSLDFYETMASADTLLGDYKSAANFQQQYIQLYRQLNTNNLSTQLANYQKLFELKEKEAAIQLLEKENQVIKLKEEKSRFYLIIAVLGILVLLLGLVIIYRSLVVRTLLNHRLTKLNDQISEQKEDLSNQNTLLENTIRDLKQTQAKLIRSEKMASIGVFVSGVAHELNNPINVVNGGLHVIEKNLAELLNDNQKSDPELLSDLNIMLKESGKSIEKINSIIQALSMATYTEQQPMKVDFSQIVDNVLLGLDLYTYRDVELIRHSPSEVVECFPNRIHHALKSVMENALHYARKTAERVPVVRVESKTKGSDLIVQVANNGPEIQEGMLLKIFDPFFTTKSSEMSPGLGLYFAFSAFTEHHGSIEAKNQDGWVIFEMCLPKQQLDN